MRKHHYSPLLAIIAGAVLIAPACAERAVDMDGQSIVNIVNTEATKNAEADVVVVLNEPTHELRSDGTRLFWFSDLQSSTSNCPWVQTKALRSCALDDCANTLVTYANSVIGCNGTDHSLFWREPISRAFATDGVNIYWGTQCSDPSSQALCHQILSCPVTGCDPEPSIVLSGHTTAEYVLNDKLYWLRAEPLGLERCVPERCAETVEDLATFDADETVRGLTLGSTHAYWFSGSDLRRIALDRQSPVETVASSLSDPKGLTVTGSDVYWANHFFPGTITRCPVEGCTNEAPSEILAKLTYPSWTGVIGSSLFWTSGPGPGTETQIQHCPLADCSRPDELEATGLLGRCVQDDSLFYGTTTDGGATTAIHRRKY